MAFASEGHVHPETFLRILHPAEIGHNTILLVLVSRILFIIDPPPTGDAVGNNSDGFADCTLEFYATVISLHWC